MIRHEGQSEMSAPNGDTGDRFASAIAKEQSTELQVAHPAQRQSSTIFTLGLRVETCQQARDTWSQRLTSQIVIHSELAQLQTILEPSGIPQHS